MLGIHPPEKEQGPFPRSFEDGVIQERSWTEKIWALGPRVNTGRNGQQTNALPYQVAAKPFGHTGGWGWGVRHESVIASLREAPLSLQVLWALTKPDQTSKCRQDSQVLGLRTHTKPISKQHLKEGSEPGFPQPH